MKQITLAPGAMMGLRAMFNGGSECWQHEIKRPILGRKFMYSVCN